MIPLAFGRYPVSFALGFLVGVVVTGAVVWFAMPKVMFIIRKSHYGVDETVERIQAAAGSMGGWQVPKVYNIQQSLIKAGHPDAKPVRIMSLCHPHHAYAVLKDEKNRLISSIMPCRVGIYQMDNGDVYVAMMNSGLMSKMFGPDVARVMKEVSEDEEKMLTAVTEA